jgi:hypothetical protein
MSSAIDFLQTKYPAKFHAKKVTEWIASHGGSTEGLLYLEAQKMRFNEVRFLLILGSVGKSVNHDIGQ